MGLRDAKLLGDPLLCFPILEPPSRKFHDALDPDPPGDVPEYRPHLYYQARHKQSAATEYKPVAYVYTMHPGNRLRELRKSAGLSQTDLAERTGVSQSAISQIENGRMPLTVEWMRAFGREIGCAPSDLLIDDDVPDRLSQEERELIAHFRASSPEARSFIRTSTAAVAEPKPAYQPKRTAA